MKRMTTQQRLDCLLKRFAHLERHQGDGVMLNENEVSCLKKQCDFANRSEIAFYISSLEDRGLMKSECSTDYTMLGGRITIDGYCHLDNLGED